MMIDLKADRIRIIIIMSIVFLAGVGSVFLIWKYDSIRAMSDISFEKNIDKRIYNIIHSKDIQVMISSNPYNYIKDVDSSKDFEYIVSQGDRALEYMMTRLEKSSRNGLEEYIMAMACSRILNEMEKDKRQSTGKDWLSKYLMDKK